MHDRVPTVSKRRAWTLLLAWTAVIYATVPLARAIQETVTEHWGRASFTYMVIVCAVVAVLCAVAYLWKNREMVRGRQFFWLVLVGAIYIVRTIQLRANPEEALHYIQYGVLGIAAFHVATHYARGAAVYIGAAVICTVIGTVDEVLQWVTPKRFWDYRDVWLNASAGGLMQIAIALGIRPASPGQGCDRESIRWIARWLLAFCLLLLLCVSNTPDAIRRYAVLPGLRFLQHNPSIMTEFGYLHEDAAWGRFKSRFTLEELQMLSSERGAEVAQIISQYETGDLYWRFLHDITPVTDPYAHEVGVRLFRRDFYRDRSWGFREKDQEQYVYHQTVACRENEILLKYYGGVMDHSSRKLVEDSSAGLRHNNDEAMDYESPVGGNLVTRVSQRQIQYALLIFACCCAWFSRRSKASTRDFQG